MASLLSLDESVSKVANKTFGASSGARLNPGFCQMAGFKNGLAVKYILEGLEKFHII